MFWHASLDRIRPRLFLYRPTLAFDVEALLVSNLNCLTLLEESILRRQNK